MKIRNNMTQRQALNEIMQRMKKQMQFEASSTNEIKRKERNSKASYNKSKTLGPLIPLVAKSIISLCLTSVLSWSRIKAPPSISSNFLFIFVVSSSIQQLSIPFPVNFGFICYFSSTIRMEFILGSPIPRTSNLKFPSTFLFFIDQYGFHGEQSKFSLFLIGKREAERRKEWLIIILSWLMFDFSLLVFCVFRPVFSLSPFSFDVSVNEETSVSASFFILEKKWQFILYSYAHNVESLCLCSILSSRDHISRFASCFSQLPHLRSFKLVFSQSENDSDPSLLRFSHSSSSPKPHTFEPGAWFWSEPIITACRHVSSCNGTSYLVTTAFLWPERSLSPVESGPACMLWDARWGVSRTDSMASSLCFVLLIILFFM